MKLICKFHEANPDQQGVMNCPECNRCDCCGKISYTMDDDVDPNHCLYCEVQD